MRNTHTEDEVVEILLLNVMDDDFIGWVKSKRNNKRIIKQLGIEDKVAKLTGKAKKISY